MTCIRLYDDVEIRTRPEKVAGMLAEKLTVTILPLGKDGSVTMLQPRRNIKKISSVRGYNSEWR
ncbi:11824_t:CDS:2 [Entrophospora sp. SA101]|nr:11824_t:CDS:2 [Entrophospora sp. SA101]